jgi:HSP20 family protein
MLRRQADPAFCEASFPVHLLSQAFEEVFPMATRSLMRRDPFVQDLLDFRRSFDDVFQRFFAVPYGGEWGGREPMTTWMPPIELYTEKDKIHARVALPGVKPQDVNVQVHQNRLIVSGERKQEKEIKDEQYLQCELSYGRFERSIMLPEGVNAEKVEASFHDGVLDIMLPLAEKAQPRRIEVKAQEPGKKLAA